MLRHSTPCKKTRLCQVYLKPVQLIVLLPVLAHSNNIPEFTKTISCMRCNRRLSHPDSIARGMGAWCARTVAYETRRGQETPSYSFTPHTKSYFSRKDQLVQQNWRVHQTIKSGQQSNGFSGMKLIESVEDRFHWPDMDAIANLLIPECCCCERVLVRGQLTELVSNTLGKDVFFCRECYAVACDPRSTRCNLEVVTWNT